MKFYPYVFFALLCAFFPRLLLSQVIAYQQAQQDSFLHQAHYYKNCARFEPALAYAEKAISLYETQRSPLLAEAYYFAGLFAQNLGRGQESETYYKKTISLHSPQEPSQKWKNFYALRAQYELQKKYQIKDSLTATNKKIIALLEQKAAVKYETELDISICNFLYSHYLGTQQMDLANTFINKGVEICKTAKKQTQAIVWDCKTKYYYFQVFSKQNGLIDKKKIKDVLVEIQAATPVLPVLGLQAYKAEFLLNFVGKDTSELLKSLANLKRFTLQHFGEQSVQMGYYHLDYGTVLKDAFLRRKEAAAEIEKGLPLLEKSQEARDRKNYTLACFNLGTSLSETAETPAEFARARSLYYKGLQHSIGTEGKEVNVDNLPNFADTKTRCDNPELTYRLLQSLYYSYYYLYDESFKPEEQKLLLTLLDKLTQLHERNTAALQNGANAERVAEEYRKLQSDHIFFYLQLYRTAKTKAALDQLIRYGENTKSISTRRRLNQDKAFALAGVPAEIITAYKQEKAILQNLEIDYAILLRENRRKEADKVQQAIVDKKLTLQKQETDLQKKYPQYARLMYNPPVIGLDDIQKRLDTRSAFLYCIDYYETEMQIVICKDTAWLVENITDRTFNNPLMDFVKISTIETQITGLSDKQLLDSFASCYRYLAKRFFPSESILAGKSINQLIISPAYLSNIIPFELLLLSDKKENDSYHTLDYLLKKYAVQYVNSATLWLENKQQSAQNSHNGKILAYAPTYQKGVKNELRTGATKAMRTNLSELTGTLKEIENLKSFYYGDYRAGVEANEALFRKDIEQPYTILHLATHGLWDEDNPDLSALALSESADTLEDNFLSAYELAQLQTRSQLVVLSACETAKGEQQNTDGVMSIARYLMYGGAPAVIATRWQVNDQATAFIMQNFYKYLYEGKTVKEAIKTAQLDYLSQAKGIAAHPFYWAAFTNIGNTDVGVYLAGKDWALKYYLIGILSLSVIIGWGWRKRRKGRE